MGRRVGSADRRPFPNEPGAFPGAQTGEVPQLVTMVDDWIHIWNLDVDSWPDIACEAAGRNMTEAEWDQFGPRGESYQATCPQYGDRASPGLIDWHVAAGMPAQTLPIVGTGTSLLACRRKRCQSSIGVGTSGSPGPRRPGAKRAGGRGS